ncbi:FadR/GntR family transcriptional regulator [Mesorhizobium marinum]|uniref:FadR/GntR family transcriptional regulator n=1 Tax=Mesorhizobium marinum TaxID=3228790 RepID=UPI003466A9C9
MAKLTPSSLLLGANKKFSLFAHVVEELGASIVSGEIKPEDPFPNEAELGQRFQASRSVIREAVKSLAAKGLLESRTRSGIRVLPPHRWNLLDVSVLSWRYGSMPHELFFDELFEIRSMIEPRAAALAAERATKKEVAAIEAALGAMGDAEADSNGAIEADLAFHRAILSAAHNPLLLQMGNLIGIGLLTSYRISSEPYAEMLATHVEIFEAIRNRDAGLAQQRMEMLLHNTRTFQASHA